MSLVKGLYKTLDPLFLYQIEPYISTPDGFLYPAFLYILVTLTVVRFPITLKIKGTGTPHILSRV